MTEATLLDGNLAAHFEGMTTEHFFTEEQFQRDVDYYRSQIIARRMLEAGLITTAQFNRLTELNRQSFLPFLVEIMPKLLDKSGCLSDI